MSYFSCCFLCSLADYLPLLRQACREARTQEVLVATDAGDVIGELEALQEFRFRHLHWARHDGPLSQSHSSPEQPNDPP